MISVRAFIAGLVLLAQPAEIAAGVSCHGRVGPNAGHCAAPSTRDMPSVTATTTSTGCQAALACQEQVPVVSGPYGVNDLPEFSSLRVSRFSPSLVSVIVDGPPTPPPNR